MLSEDQIDYLLQIKASKQVIPNDTVRVMLKALRWQPDEIERGITFLNRPEVKEEPKPVAAEMSAPEQALEPEEPKLKPIPSIKIKQNPFPVGSPFAQSKQPHREKRHKKIIYLGAFLGLVVFIVAIIFYTRMNGVGQ